MHVLGRFVQHITWPLLTQLLLPGPRQLGGSSCSKSCLMSGLGGAKAGTGGGGGIVGGGSTMRVRLVVWGS